MVIETAQKYGFKKYIPLTFIKNSSPQALKANMRIVGATERALVLFRDKLPKFNNGRKVDENGRNIKGTGRMILDWMNWERDKKGLIPKIHPTQKPVNVLKKLIEIYTDEGDVVIDPVAGTGRTSWSNGGEYDECDWRYCKLAEDAEQNVYSKEDNE